MKTEQEKYIEAVHKVHELKKSFDEMLPETKVKFLQDIVKATGTQHLLNELQKYHSNKY